MKSMNNKDTAPQADEASAADADTLPPIQQRIQVTFEYPVRFSRDIFSPENALLREVMAPNDQAIAFNRKAICFVDANVAEAHPDLLDKVSDYFAAQLDAIPLACPPIVLPGGEIVKQDPAHVDAVINRIAEYRLCRKCYVVAIGGGALIDMVGYACAIAHRGIPLVRIPTTVLAQNDAALSVKNAINAYNAKNFLGTFTPPHSVICDADFLATLDTRDWIGGVSEAIKVALLQDAEFFRYMEENVLALRQRDLRAMQRVIYRCAQLHLDHIGKGGDPLERGSSRPLDFGHWAAHKLESLTNFKLHHGEAVAIGLALDSTYSWQMGLIDATQWERIINLLTELGLPVFDTAMLSHLDAPDDPASVLRGLHEFREHLGGPLTIMLLRDIGHGHEVHEMDLAVVVRSIRILEGFFKKKA
jgi:3-dehydroquinate synthase